MTKPLPFTEASIRRAINGVMKAGLRVTAIEVRPDGTVVVRNGVEVAPALSQNGLVSETELPPQNSEEWGEVEA
jgi:hypothetical protein